MQNKKASSSQGTAFDTFLNAAVDMYKEADSLQKSAESAEMSYALGYSDNIHDVAAAARKVKYFPAVYSEGYKCGGIRIQRIDEHATINLCI